MRSERFRLVFLFFALVCLAASPKNSAEPKILPTSLPLPQIDQVPIVSVGLYPDTPFVSVGFEQDHDYEIADVKTGEPLFRGSGPFEAVIVDQGKDGFQINNEPYNIQALVIRSHGSPIRVVNRTYNGEVRIFKSSKTWFHVINEIDIEQYVKGVLPLEVDPAWHIEALKAQAVASRTYALFKSIERRKEDFALHDTVKSQVYGGAAVQNSLSDEAVEATRGEVLSFNGNIFPAFFHASCGGQTAQADLIWPVEPHPVLQGVSDPFCKGTPHDEWSLKLPLREVELAMQNHGFPAQNLKEIELLGRDASGRIREVKLTYERSNVVIPASDFRLFLGNDRFRSLNVQIELKGETVQWKCLGWGHGAGLCQWGAKGQADQGKTYREILTFYFPGSEIKKAY